MKVSKSAIRNELRALRRQLAPRFVEAASSAVTAALHQCECYRGAAALVAYISTENEISVSGIFEDALESGRQLYLPSTSSPRRLKRWRPGEPLVIGRGGTLEPLQGDVALPENPTLALVPLVAWDRSGTRLGRGGGFYDKLFADLGGSFRRVGIGYEFQYWPDLPCDSWDVNLHSVITECRVVEFGQ
ncbi:MAG: 5-formyltetrahydrofolate cyclo-ligase [Deltaproteobacteria bacterium]|nr:5-formyltetrahydrofolate cyclo-ligase [Deltaproteobacteria bacterium]